VRGLVATIALALFALGSAWQLRQFLRDGRGHYHDAIDYMVSHTPADRSIAATSDNDFRNGMVLAYHLRAKPPARPVEYLNEQQVNGGQIPQWLIMHRFDHEPPPQNEITGPGLLPFRLRREFAYYGASGWFWDVYERVGDTPVDGQGASPG
jgi:hypothetical protein